MRFMVSSQAAPTKLLMDHWKKWVLSNHFEHSGSIPSARPFFKSVFFVEINSFLGANQFKADSPIQRFTFSHIAFQCCHKAFSSAFSLVGWDYREILNVYKVSLLLFLHSQRLCNHYITKQNTDPLFSGFHPIIYGKRGIFAIAKIVQKNLCPGN